MMIPKFSFRSNWKQSALLCVCLLAILAIALPSAAQNINARIQGTVTDPAGAVVPGATVRVINVDTNVVAFEGKTDSQGAYSAPEVVPGRYKLTAEAPGFKVETISNITASIDQGITLDFKLQQGSVTESVVVTSDTQAQLDQSDATISTTITPIAVQDLPLPNRDITSVFLLTGGVAQGSNTNSQNNAQLSFNGSRTLGTNPLVDGTSVIVASTGSIATLPSPDALSEVKIISSDSSAQYGRSSGATILFTTKSGTNKFHGGLYTLLRNEDLDANTFSNKINGLPRNRDRFLQYGGTIGGPVVLPKLYNGRDKTFFFFNYDHTINTAPTVVTQTVPSAAFRSGDFSTAATPVYDPLTHKPFPNNIIPAGRIDPAAAKYLALLPQSNSTGTADPANSRNINNFVSPQSLRTTSSKYTGRIDETIGSKLTLFGSDNHFLSTSPQAVVFNSVLDQNASGTSGTGWEAALGGTYTVSATFIAELHLGLYHEISSAVPASLGINVQNVLGVQSAPINQTPTTTISGYASMGPALNSTIIQINQTVSEYGAVTKLLGHHTLKAGGELRKNQFERVSPTSYSNGQFSFDGTITNKTNNTGSPVNAEADFLLGAVKTAQYEIPQPGAGRRNYNPSFFAQDDWRVNSKLTANIGLRQEFESPLTVAHNIYTRFDATTGLLLVAGKNADASLNTPTPRVNIGPHVGFAYTPRNGTVVRAGFSVVFGQIFSNLGGQVASPGYDVVTQFLNQGTGKAQPFTLSQGLPLIGVQNVQDPAASLGTGSPAKPLSDASASQFFSLNSLPQTQQWNLGLQQQLPLATVFELDYIGSHGIHLPLNLTLNQPQTVDAQGNLNIALANQIAAANTTTTTQLARPFPNLQGIQGQGDYSGAHYHSLQAQLRRQFTSSIGFVATYTWSKEIDDASGIFSFSQPSGLGSQIPYSPALRKKYDVGLGEFDQRNAFSAGFQVTTPGNRWERDFRLSGIFVAHSGLPRTISQSNLFPGVNAQRPNGNAHATKLATPYHNGKAIQYLEPASDPNFPLSPTGPVYGTVAGKRVQILGAGLGNSGRDTVIGPGEQTLNLAASRTFTLHENLSIQFRVDALNALNHTNLQGPNTSLTVTPGPVVGNAIPSAIFNSAGFGQITNAYQTRQLQLLARITF